MTKHQANVKKRKKKEKKRKKATTNPLDMLQRPCKTDARTATKNQHEKANKETLINPFS